MTFLFEEIVVKIDVHEDAELVVREVAGIIVAEARPAVAERIRFVVAVTGGHTLRLMMRALLGEEVPLEGVLL